MDENQYSVRFEKVHFRTCLLTYSDTVGSAQAYFEESAVPDYDWIGDEPSFDLTGERLGQILPRLQAWADDCGIRLKIWRASELGI